MTRVIAENAIDSDVSAVEYAQRQLERRPASTSSVTPPAFAQVESSMIVEPSTLTAVGLHIGEGQQDVYSTPGQDIVVPDQRASDDLWGVLCTRPGWYACWSLIHLDQSSITNPVRVFFADISDGAAPGTINNQAYGHHIRPGMSINSQVRRGIVWYPFFSENEGDWESDMFGGHGLPLRLSVKVFHTEPDDILVFSEVAVTLIHPLDETPGS